MGQRSLADLTDEELDELIATTTMLGLKKAAERIKAQRAEA